MQELKAFGESPGALVRCEFVDALDAAVSALYGSLKTEREHIEQSVSIPNVLSLGDISSSIAFKLAKLARTDPAEIAKSIAKKVKPTEHLVRFDAANGYVNAFIDDPKYSGLVLQSVMQAKGSYGSGKKGEGKKVLVEFPSVNPVKPWHVGHLRSALLGDTLSNAMAFSGYNVERTDYIDDLGLQVAETLWAYLNTDMKPDKKFDLWLGEKYVKATTQVKEKADEINGILKLMEEGNNDTARKAREITEMAVKAQYQTAFDYGIYHDVLMWESDIVNAKLLGSALESAVNKGVVRLEISGDYKNCMVVDLERVKHLASEFENPKEKVRVLVRSNGVATYAAKDLAFHLWKFGLMDKKFRYSVFIDRQPNGKPLYTTSQDGVEKDFGSGNMIVNAIDAGQSPEQQIVRALINLMGYVEQSQNYVHVAYGKVALEGGALKGRSGNWLGEERNYTADDLLSETKKKALEIVSGSKKISEDANPEQIAKAIALAAIKFEYLRIAPEKSMVFSWKSALDFEGNSGPYVLYTYARASKILKMAGYKQEAPSQQDLEQMTRGYDFGLVKSMGMAQEMVEKACAEFRPNVLTDYLLELSSLFSKFYETMPVIKGEQAKNIRLAVVSAFTQVTGNILGLLGIAPVEEM